MITSNTRSRRRHPTSCYRKAGTVRVVRVVHDVNTPARPRKSVPNVYIRPIHKVGQRREAQRAFASQNTALAKREDEHQTPRTLSDSSKMVQAFAIRERRRLSGTRLVVRHDPRLPAVLDVPSPSANAISASEVA